MTAVLLEQEQQVRRQMAGFLGVRPEHLAWTSNTSQAMQRVLRSADWRPGDEIVVSSAEHVGTQDVCRALERHRGVVVRTFPADEGDDALLSGLEAALTGRARLVCLSQVSTLDGRRLPAREAAGLARARGVPLMLDGAQAVGQFPVEIPALGCDYYIASGHKWLLGPWESDFFGCRRIGLPSFARFHPRCQHLVEAWRYTAAGDGRLALRIGHPQLRLANRLGPSA